MYEEKKSKENKIMKYKVKSKVNETPLKSGYGMSMNH